MDYEIIKSKFGGEMLYVPSEKMLYVRESQRNDKQVYVCYQTVLAHKNKKEHTNNIKCRASVYLLNNKCERMNMFVPHTNHLHHETLAGDKRRMQNMKEEGQYINVHFKEDAHNIPNRRIYQRNVPMLVSIFIQC